MKTLGRHLLLILLALTGGAGTAPALTLTQTIPFDSIAPFGTFTTGDFVTSGWNQPFVFTDPSEITEIRVAFASEDSDWLDQMGPLGGEPRVEIGFLDDAMNRFAVASVSLGSPSFVLGNAQEPWFSAVRSLIVDGAITASLGGFEYFPDHSESFAFTGPSWLTLEIDGSVTDPVPEPAGVALLGLGLVAVGAYTERRRRCQR